MSSSLGSRFLSTTSDDRSLALKMFWGTVMEAFRKKTILWDESGSIVARKQVGAGKSWQFPQIGQDPSPEYHVPGTELLGMAVKVDEGLITIDDILVSHYDIPLDQTLMSHFDVLGPFAKKLGRSLAINFDNKLFRVGLKAAREGQKTKEGHTIHDGGNQVSRIAADVETAFPMTTTGSANLWQDLGDLAVAMDEDNVSEDGRFIIFTPYAQQVLLYEKDVFDKDFQMTPENTLNGRVVGMVQGFRVLRKTNNMPQTNITTGVAKYQGNFSVTSPGHIPVALALCGADEGEAAIGYVQAGGIHAHRHFDERRNTTFMKAQMIVGAGIISPYCAGTIDVSSA